MSFFTRLFGIERKQNTYEAINLHDESASTAIVAVGPDGLPVMNETLAMQLTVVACAVRVLAEGLAQMPMSVKQRTYKGGVAETAILPAHWATRLVQDMPNTWQTAYEFVEQAVFCASLYGDFVAVKDKAVEPTQLIPITPGSWSLDRDATDMFYRVTLPDGGRKRFPASMVLHVRGPSMNGYSGLQPILLARKALSLATSIETHQTNQAKSGGRPSGILSTETQLGPDTVKALAKQWNARFGAGGEGGVALLDGGWAFTPMSMSSVDAQYLETRRFQIEEVARAFRIFPQMLMQSDKTSTFASAESFFRAHVVHTLGPWIERFEGALRRGLLTEADRRAGIYIDMDEENLLRADPAVMGGYYSQALGAGGSPAWMTQDEVRARRGLNPQGGSAAVLPQPTNVSPQGAPDSGNNQGDGADVGT